MASLHLDVSGVDQLCVEAVAEVAGWSDGRLSRCRIDHEGPAGLLWLANRGIRRTSYWCSLCCYETAWDDMVRVVKGTKYSIFGGALFDFIVATVLFLCNTEGGSLFEHIAWTLGGLFFTLLGARLIFCGRVRVDRETRTVHVPRLLWGKHRVSFDEISGIGVSDTVCIIGEWGKGATVVTIAVGRVGSEKVRAVRCYSMCGYTVSDAVNMRVRELRDAIGEWDHTPWLDWFGGAPITEMLGTDDDN